VLWDGAETVRLFAEGAVARFQCVSADGKTREVRFEFPCSAMLGEVAWDSTRFWIPTSAGLYEVDRATGKTTWLAYAERVRCFSVLRHKDRLYVPTTQGLYWYQIAPREGGK
jgi:ligand-binding sensor domain-containing protein